MLGKYLWAIYTMAMLNNQRVSLHIAAHGHFVRHKVNPNC